MHYIIEGGRPLGGSISVMGAKNYALKLIAASFLSAEPITLRRVPYIEDVSRMLEIVVQMGGRVHYDTQTGTAVIDTAGVQNGQMPSLLTRQVRASAALIGPLLARFGNVSMPHPGGCLLGKRPIDIFIDGFSALGASVSEDEEAVYFSASRLRGGKFFMPQISVTATETLLMAAVLAEGVTVLENAACEPEIPALAAYLNAHGAHIEGAGTHTLTIAGTDRLSAGEAEVIPDRLETGTFAILAAAARCALRIERAEPAHAGALWAYFDRMGVPYVLGKDYVELRKPDDTKPFNGVNVKTHEYPGFITDLQAPFTVLLTQCAGLSMVHETIFEGRLFYVDKLNRMGANIILADPHRALVQGPTPLRGKHLESPDIRAGMALVIAGLIAQGETRIDAIYQIERGYATIAERLSALGAHIERCQ